MGKRGSFLRRIYKPVAEAGGMRKAEAGAVGPTSVGPTSPSPPIGSLVVIN